MAAGARASDHRVSVTVSVEYSVCVVVCDTISVVHSWCVSKVVVVCVVSTQVF